MRTIDPNFRDLLKCFNAAGVRYLVLGGYAVNFHGYHRSTKDIDLWIALDPANAQRVSSALQAFGFPADAVPPEKFTVKGDIHSFGRAPFRVDILSNPDGVDFEACYSRRVERELDGVTIPWIALEDLKVNKLTSNRNQDRADLENLPPTSIV